MKKATPAKKVKTARPAMPKKAPTKVELPEGFRDVTTDHDVHETWDFDSNPVLKGTITRIAEVNTKTRFGERETTVMNVVDDNGEVWALWESANMKELFANAREGFKVWVQYLGQMELTDGRTMKKFKCALARGEDNG